MVKRIRVFRVDAALEKYDRRLPAIKRRLERLNKNSPDFMRQFAERSKKVIRPMMRAIGEHLKNRGHGCRIENYHAHYAEERKYRAGITMIIHPRGQKPYGQGLLASPSISFFADSRGRMVWVYVCEQFSGYGNAPILVDSLDLASLDIHAVERKIVDALDGIFDPQDFTPADMEIRRDLDTKTLVERSLAEQREMHRRGRAPK